MHTHWIPRSFMMNCLRVAIRAWCLVSFTGTTLYDAINRRRTPHTCDFNYEPRLSELMGGKHVSNFTQCVKPIYLQRAALSILYWQTPPQPDASPIVPSHTAWKRFLRLSSTASYWEAYLPVTHRHCEHRHCCTTASNKQTNKQTNKHSNKANKT
jgi:hypothetical protein